MRIVMIGAGYVGLVTGACLADFGHEVVCVDTQEDKGAGRLSFTTNLSEAARGAKAAFIAVGTPSLAEIGAADLRYVHAAAREIADVVKDFTVVVVKSTVPVGSCDEVERILAERLPRDRFAVVSNPEFLREGAAIE